MGFPEQTRGSSRGDPGSKVEGIWKPQFGDEFDEVSQRREALFEKRNGLRPIRCQNLSNEIFKGISEQAEAADSTKGRRWIG